MGTDEVGRGAFAGPVVTGVVVLPRTNVMTCTIKNNIPTWVIDSILIRDSKLLSEIQRERASEWILKNCISWGIGVGSVVKINEKGIVPATNMAFRSAIKHATKTLPLLPSKLYIDAFYIPEVPNYPKTRQEPIIHGDRQELCIAAASIIAKVYRDRKMRVLGNKIQYQPYEWHQNKGYGTMRHRIAIQKFGTTKHHRDLYVRTSLERGM